MRQITVNAYKFSELAPKVREQVKREWAERYGYSSADERIASLSALAKHFGGKLVDWNIAFFGGRHSSADFVFGETITEEEIEKRLANLGSFDETTLEGHGECKLTGFCADEDAIDGFRRAWFAGIRNLDRLMQAAFRSWLKIAQSDCEYEYSDSAFSEMCDDNEYEFFDDGRLVDKAKYT